MTLQAKDLRVGNYVKRVGENTHVTIYLFWLLAESHATMDEIQPISLTSEWLERFGFEEAGDFGYKHPSHQESGRWITRKKMLSDEKLERPFLRFDMLVDIYYVHHLQNFFYAISGTELTLKEKVTENGIP